MKVFWCALALLVVWGMKRYYADARADDLWWILSPTAHLAGVMTGASFQMEAGAGYLSRERLFLIEKSCAGVNFMIAAFGMSVFVLRRRITSVATGATVFGVSFLGAYSAAVVINSVRIAIATWLVSHPPALLQLSPAQIHRLEGIAVYFGGLVLLYELVLCVDRGAITLRKKS